jgi:hypothetical protein
MSRSALIQGGVRAGLSLMCSGRGGPEPMQLGLIFRRVGCGEGAGRLGGAGQGQRLDVGGAGAMQGNGTSGESGAGGDDVVEEEHALTRK